VFVWLQVLSVAGVNAAPGGQLSATFLAEGPALNRHSVLGNCQNNIPAMFGNKLIMGGLKYQSKNATVAGSQQPTQVVVVGSSQYWWLEVVQGVKKAECAPA
jgi:hypothetical protein